MTYLTATLLLLFCQTDQPSAEPFTPQTQVLQPSTPELQLDEADMKRYRRALHLIDVRGKYEEGLKILDDLAGEDDVLAVPGQSAWMLAHAYRAALLTGNDFDEEQIVQAIRTQSVGTAFEPHVLQVLSAVAGQGSGLDAEFLEHLVAELRASKSVSELRRAYGRQVLPYAKSIVDDQLDAYSFQTRTLAFHLAFSVLDASSSRWAAEVLGQGTPWSAEMLKVLFDRSSSKTPRFEDVMAKDAGLQALLSLHPHLDPEQIDTFGQALLGCLGFDRGGTLSNQATDAEQAAMDLVLRLIQAEVFEDPVELLLRNLPIRHPHLSDWLTQQIGSMRDWPQQQEFRNKIVLWRHGQHFLMAWAKDGTDADLIRLLLAYVEDGYAILNSSPESTTTWIHEQTKAQGYPINLHEGRTTRSLNSMPDWAMPRFRESTSPVVRLLLGILHLKSGDFDQAGSLLAQLGDDPSWASHLLGVWVRNWRGKPISVETVHILAKLSKQEAFREDAKTLLIHGGRSSLPYSVIRDCGLDMQPDVLETVMRKAWENGDAETLQVILGDHLHDPEQGSQASSYIVAIDPDWLLGMQEEIQASGHLAWHAGSIVGAWRAIAARDGREELLRRTPEILATARAMPKDSAAGALFGFLLGIDQDLAIQVALEGLRPEVFTEMFGSTNYRDTDLRQGDPEWTSRLVQVCAEASVTFPFANKLHFIGRNLSANSTSAQAALEALWEQPLLTRNEMDVVIDLSIQNPKVREALRNRIEAGLSDKSKIHDITASLQRWGAVGDFQPALLEALHGGLPESSQSTLLTTLSSLDDPAVIEALMDALNDPRPRVSSAASAGLDRIQRLRQQRAEWQAWSDGVQMVSPVVALMEDLKDPSLDIRIAAIQSLGTLGDKAALPVLVDLLREEDPAIKEAAKAALARINAAPQAAVPKKD